MSEGKAIDGYLAHCRSPRLKIGCAGCARQGDYSVATLRKLYGNPPIAELPRLVAMRGDCALALRYPGTECQARFLSDEAPIVEYLGDAYHAGWRAILTCQRRRQGLNSVKPCRGSYVIDLGGLVAGLGQAFPIELLARKLCCPDCGSRHYVPSWTVPDKPSSSNAAPLPLRRAG